MYNVIVYPINKPAEVAQTFPTYAQARSYQAEMRRQKLQSSIEKVKEGE
jgi:hypothetical protein